MPSSLTPLTLMTHLTRLTDAEPCLTDANPHLMNPRLMDAEPRLVNPRLIDMPEPLSDAPERLLSRFAAEDYTLSTLAIKVS